MARSLPSFTFAVAIAALVLLGARAAPALAQPASTATAASGSKYPDLDAIIQQMLRDRNLPKATAAFERALRKYPELPSAHVLMYQVLAELNQPSAARQQLEEAVKYTPSDPEPYVILGNIAVLERRLAEAALDFKKAKQLLATYTIAPRKGAIEQMMTSGIAQLAETREDWKEAESRLRDLVKLAPEDSAAYRRLAHSLSKQGKAHEAVEVLTKAEKIDHKNAKTRGRRELLSDLECISRYYDNVEDGPNSEAGERWYRDMLTMAPDDLDIREKVAKWFLEKKGDILFAKLQAEAALRIEKSDPKKYGGSKVGRELHGLVALWEKDWKEAEKYFQSVILEVPTDFAARNNIALALVEQDDPAKKNRALQYAEANYRDNKDGKYNADALATLGWVHFKRGEFDQAKLVLELAVKATAGNVSNGDTGTYLAYVLYHQGQKWQAKELLEAFLKSGQPFAMKPEAKQLYEKVKDAAAP